jgi:hypothetical protein
VRAPESTNSFNTENAEARRTLRRQRWHASESLAQPGWLAHRRGVAERRSVLRVFGNASPVCLPAPSARSLATVQLTSAPSAPPRLRVETTDQSARKKANRRQQHRDRTVATSTLCDRAGAGKARRLQHGERGGAEGAEKTALGREREPGAARLAGAQERRCRAPFGAAAVRQRLSCVPTRAVGALARRSPCDVALRFSAFSVLNHGLVRPQRLRWVDSRGAACGNQDGHERHTAERERGERVCHRIAGGNPEDERRHHSAQ